jgi:hypothetical protein
MRNPFRSVLNVVVAALATVALGPVVFSPTAAFARGGGGGGGGRGGSGGVPVPSGGGGGGPGGPGGNSGGRGSTSGGKGGNKSGKGSASGQAVKPSEYLLLIQQDDSDDHRADFLVDALDDATIEARDKDRAAALAASRETQSRHLRSDDMPRP